MVGCVAPPAVLPRWSVWILRVAPGTMRPNNIGPQPYHMALFELARNCRTLKANWRRGLLAQLASDMRCDIIALQEVSIRADPGLHCEDLGAGWTFWYTTADHRGRGGVGALIGPRLQQSYRCVSLSPGCSGSTPGFAAGTPACSARTRRSYAPPR